MRKTRRSVLEWLLLTTVEVQTFEDAWEPIVWYNKRWGIEIFHRTRKDGGCKAEELPLGTGDRFAVLLALGIVFAWRIYYRVKIGKEVPCLPCTSFFEIDEGRALVACSKSRPPTALPTT
ncbi:MAG: hypothetical protein JZU50_10300 [Desulfobulbaceae bacterium]|nr:hypothetical protein [Desulfobulbaceae bacterium]